MTVDDVAIAPGWYADPAIAGQLRWWTGAGWTEHVAAVHDPVADAPVASSPPLTRREARRAESHDGAVDPSATDLSGRRADKPPTIPTSWTPTRWNTSAAWILATTPLILWAADMLGLVVAFCGGSVELWRVIVIVMIVITAVAATMQDHATLRRRGMVRPPSTLWTALGPLFYLAARATRIKAEGGRGAAPFWVFVASIPVAVFLLPTVVDFVLGFILVFTETL